MDVYLVAEATAAEWAETAGGVRADFSKVRKVLSDGYGLNKCAVRPERRLLKPGKCAFHVGNGRKARKMASQNTDKQGVSDVVRVRCLCHFGDIGISLRRHRHVAGGDIGISPK